ncbi:MAG: hypothetical protein OEM52_08450 [bacterium]|nr:hypothetical protein [bacterium]
MKHLLRYIIVIGILSSFASSIFALPTIELAMLQDPSTLAIGITLPQTRLLKFGQKIGNTGFRRFDVKVSADILHPFDYHPQGHANAALAFGMNWGASMPNPGKLFQGTYIGTWYVEEGVESDLDTNKKYRAQNYTTSLGYDQQIPYTDFARVAHKSAMPMVIGAAVSSVRNIYPIDTSSIRADAHADWSVPLLLGTSWLTNGQAHWSKDVKPYGYVESGATYPLPMQQLNIPFVGFQPVLFARFVAGRRPPDYELINSWEYGLTSTVTIGGK